MNDGGIALEGRRVREGLKAAWRFDTELAWLRFWRKPARTLVGAWAVIVAVAAVTFVLSLGDGLHDYLSERLQIFAPALWVQATKPSELSDPPSEEDDDMAHRLGSLPGVTAVSRHVASPVLASSGRRSSPARLEGYDLGPIFDILPGAQSALEGRLPSAPDEIVAGVVLAAELGVRLGDEIQLIATEGQTQTVVIVGLVRVGHWTVDEQLLLAPYSSAERLVGPDARRGYALGVERGRDLAVLRLEVQRATGAWAQPWYEGRSSLFAALAIERRVMLWISLAAVVTAAFATASVTALRVMEQRYELAILQAVGAGFANTLRTVLAESVTSAAVGAALGAGLGWAAGWALSRAPISLPPEFGIAYIPVSPKLRHAFLAITLTIVSTALASIVPAVRGASLDPVEALRNK